MSAELRVPGANIVHINIYHARVHVCTSFSKIGIYWMHHADIWFVVSKASPWIFEWGWGTQQHRLEKVEKMDRFYQHCPVLAVVLPL